MNLKLKKVLKRGMILIATIVFFVIVIIVYANWKVPHDTQSFVYDDVDSIPTQKVALVLGTSKRIKGGFPNPFFYNRIQAAKELYFANKVKAFVLSGDNGASSYNEPQDMRKALISMGVPDSIIYLDYAGFRTLDSVVRMNKIFGQNSFIVVSQKFHNERAIFLAQYYGMTVYGYNAKDIEIGRNYYRTFLREKFARVKVFVDMALNKQPKFLGDTITIQ